MRSRFVISLHVLASLMVLVSACGAEPAPQPTPDAALIATSAVQTVEARLTQEAQAATAQAPLPTETAVPTQPSPQPTSTPGPTLPMPAPTSAGNVVPCFAANWLEDVTIPDGTVIYPGTPFTKIWRVKNSGSCPWDDKFSLVYASGDLLGAAYSVPLPRVILPGETADVSIDFVAPTVEGQYRGFWRLKTSGGGTIGFGPYDSSLYVDVTVASFSVTAVTFTIRRDPASGCPNPVNYIATATITTNGPGEVVYRWALSSGLQIGGRQSLVFDAAGSESVSLAIPLKPGTDKGTYSVVLFIDIPNGRKFESDAFTFACD